MRSMKRSLAVLMAILMVMPGLPVKAMEGEAPPIIEAEDEQGAAVQAPEENVEPGEEEEISDTDKRQEPEETNVSESEPEESTSKGTDENESKNEAEVNAETEEGEKNLVQEQISESGYAAVVFSTGDEYKLVVNSSVSEKEEYEGFTGIFAEDGSYTIQIPEEDPFFPYEVQFTDPEFEEVQNLWFATPDSTVEFGGHTFKVDANFTGKAVTQLSLNIAGDVVVIYPAEKNFGGVAPISLLPLEVKYLSGIDLTGYTPLELTMVSVDSIFTGRAELKDTDRIMWTTSYSDVPDYTVSQRGDSINLSYASSFQMIVGEADQLAADNIRYIVDINKSGYSGWLTPKFYTQDDTGVRTEIEVKRESYGNSSGNYEGSRYQYGYENIYLSSVQGNIQEGYLAFGVNSEKYGKTKFTSVRAFVGRHESPADAMASTEITDQIFSADMTMVDAGYKIRRYTSSYITLVSFDAQGNVTGCLPVEIYYSNVTHGINVDWLRNSSGYDVVRSRSNPMRDGCYYYTNQLYSGNPANGNYSQKMTYYNDGVIDNTKITAAYVGLYSNIAEAQAAGIENIAGKLFGTGYRGDFSSGIYFTVFIGEDGSGDQQVFKYNIKTEESSGAESVPSYINALNSGTAVSFNGLRAENESYVRSCLLQDSYAENNYIVYLVDDDVDLTKLAPTFYLSYDSLKLYAAGGSTPEVSGKSCHDFSKGPVQYTAASEDGAHSKNYWVQVVSKSSVAGQLFMNSLADSSVETKKENGVIYTTREVMLDALHDYKHDIMFANVSAEAIENLSVQLTSDVLELDEYWTLTGNHELSGFTSTETTTDYGKLSNLAMLRIRKKEGVANGTDITGTLTVKSGEAVLMVLTLTGMVGNPVITTTEIPEAVKYVPYGSMIQNSNKYSWNTVSYELWGGNLPAGMIIKPNGELYGVPTETGEFTFTVMMNNSHSSFGYSIKEFTMVVKENTNANVESQTDENYTLTNRVTYDYNSGLGDQLMVSQGVYGEFVDLWLDGVKLEKGIDYKAESGSTRITIYAQTLSDGLEDGTHTLGIEFRTDTDTLKRAAQNYVLGGKSSFEEDNTKPSESGNASNGNGSDNNAFDSSDPVNTELTAIYYTVVKGDTLWRLAARYYGSGLYWYRIYQDNMATIQSPNLLRVGQVLTIYLNSSNMVSTQYGTEQAGSTYTVQAGDSLWKIASKVYGNGRLWTRIYEANKNLISNYMIIFVRQVFFIPNE